MTGSSTSSNTATNTTTTNSAEVSTAQTNRKEAIDVHKSGYSTSGTELRRRVEQGQPNQTLTLFMPVSMAEDLAKVQFILCNDIKAELKPVKESIAAIPFHELNK